jgi:hypothetical protein
MAANHLREGGLLLVGALGELLVDAKRVTCATGIRNGKRLG